MFFFIDSWICKCLIWRWYNFLFPHMKDFVRWRVSWNRYHLTKHGEVSGMLIIRFSCSSQPSCCALSVDLHFLPLTVLQVLVCGSKAGYTIIQLSFRTGLEHLKGFTLKRQNICHLLSLPILKTHLVWFWSSYILREADHWSTSKLNALFAHGKRSSRHQQFLSFALWGPQVLSWIWTTAVVLTILSEQRWNEWMFKSGDIMQKYVTHLQHAWWH